VSGGLSGWDLWIRGGRGPGDGERISIGERGLEWPSYVAEVDAQLVE